MSDAPETIWTDGFDYSSKPTDTIGRTEYRRADLTATNAQALSNPMVVAMVEALRMADAALDGADVNKSVVKRKVNAALTDALTHYKTQFITMIEDDT